MDRRHACLVTLWMQFGAPANNNLAGNDTGQTILNQHFPRQSGDTLTLAIKSAEPITSASVKARVTGAKVNWWLPRPLARILPAVTVEDAPAAPASEPAMTRH